MDFGTYGSPSHISDNTPFEVEFLQATIDEAGNYTLHCEIANEISTLNISKKVSH